MIRQDISQVKLLYDLQDGEPKQETRLKNGFCRRRYGTDKKIKN
jgi:hypothetical protein